MASIIKTDNIQKVSDDSNIIKKCGSTITIGSCGASVALASGATQTGFGRTGTVDWDTTAKTASFTAVSGNGYFVDTTSGSVTVNLPAGSAGAIVAIADYANTADTNKIIIAANGTEKIQGVASNPFEITVEGGSVTLVYVDSTQGWRPTDASTAAAITENDTFITATGGTITCCGDYKIHTFTGPGTFCVSAGSGPVAVADYLVVAGGGGAGDPYQSGGGGAGGFRESHSTAVSGCYTASPIASSTAINFAVGAFPVTVGGGGTPNLSPVAGNPGSNSVLAYQGSSITSTGGGGGGNGDTAQTGGSGGGGGASGGPTIYNGGAGNTPPVSPSQGFPGGNGGGGPGAQGDVTGGGGGATEAGVNGCSPSTASGRGGAGTSTSITGSSVSYAGGGGGGGRPPNGTCCGAASPCGTGGAAGANGTTNRGGGAGGGIAIGPPYSPDAGNGGSGIVIIRYKFQ